MKKIRLLDFYLASPYTHKHKHVMAARRFAVTLAGARLVEKGYHFFGPITESGAYSEIYHLDSGFDFWAKHDYIMIDLCKEVWVLTIDGWKESKGVTSEIAYAKKNNKPVKYLDPETLNFIREDLT